jgi:uncharacterized membrane protein
MKYLTHNFFSRWYTARTGTVQMLLLCALFSLSMQALRVVYTGKFLFVFMAWNLFLAFIPYALSSWMSRRSFKRPAHLIWPVFVWTLFIPNSFYLLTDLFHLDMNYGVPLWFDLALLLSFAWTGLLLGLLSVRQMELVLARYLGRRSHLFFILPVMALNGLGVYVGRYLRFNSWDVLSRPFQLVQDVCDLVIHPLRNRVDWSMIACYTILLTLIYLTMKKTGKEWGSEW